MPASETFESSIEWDGEYDVVVIGFGGAGDTAGITAADAGAKVLVLEKAPEGEEGGNIRLSGQFILTTTNREAAIKYFTGLRGGYIQSDDIIELIVDKSAENKDWLISMGAVAENISEVINIEFPEFEGGGEGLSGLVVEGKTIGSFQSTFGNYSLIIP